jgi:DNA-binding NtrC family response regulator
MGPKHESGVNMTRVLVVDDQSAIRNLICEVLSGDFETGCAGSAEEAAELLPSFKPDIMLLDVSLAGISGIDALPMLKEKAPGCRIIMMTGSMEHSLAVRALSEGACDYVGKPFDILELRTKLLKIACEK